MRTNAQLTPGQSLKDVLWETMTIMQITAKNPQNVSTVVEHIYHECETWKKEKEMMRLKITKNLTYLEARKQLEQKKIKTEIL